MQQDKLKYSCVTYPSIQSTTAWWGQPSHLNDKHHSSDDTKKQLYANPEAKNESDNANYDHFSIRHPLMLA